MKTTEDFKQEIIDAAKIGVEELIKVLKEPIIEEVVSYDKDALAADRLKNAVAAKKLAMTDAFEMIARIDAEQTNLKEGKSSETFTNFTEKYAKTNG